MRTDHPLVTITQKAIGQVYQLVFRLNGDQVKRGTATTDLGLAKDYARALSKILVGKLQSNPPDGTPDLVLAMLGLEAKPKKLWLRSLDEIEQSIGGLLGDITKSPRLAMIAKQSFGPLMNSIDALFLEARRLNARVEKLEGDLGDSQAENRKLRETVDAYDALRVKDGKAVARSVEPRTLREAIDNYTSDDSTVSGTGAGERYLYTIKNYLNSFAKKIGESVKIHDLPEATVLKYIKTRKEEVSEKTGKRIKVSTVKQIATYIVALLERESGGLYPLATIRKWIEENLVKAPKAIGDFYWLEEGQTEKIIAQASKTSEYWGDAMRIQHHLALRPEEIVLLQKRYVYRAKKDPKKGETGPKKGEISHVYLCPVALEDDFIIRDLKTGGSTGSIPVTSPEAREALERRLKAVKDDGFLFARTPDSGAKTPRFNAKKAKRILSPEQKVVAEFETKHQLWDPKPFDKRYSARLKSAAKKVKGVKVDKIDGRTLRRTRGRDIVEATLSLAQASVFLRDNSKTVAKYYAKLLPGDVKA